ncbi:MAG: tetratricopeptide repeat protein [Pyrinomonadaceae bacterium]|nr:tetratricopeptide repeat protein [Pyrinomonadaceae bacterium]
MSERRLMRAALSSFLLVMTMVLIALGVSSASAQQRQRRVSASQSNKSLTIRTEANAIVWLDEIRRGTTDTSGLLRIEKITPGRHTLRVRASGFREKVQTLLPNARGQINVKLIPTTDEGELLFQQAETAREKARDDDARRAAVELYRQALAKRPRQAAAHVGLARLLSELNDYDAALDEIDRARKLRPVYPEASAVEGRILRADADNEGAMAAFRRSIREARGFQPEAHTGLALLLEEKGRNEEAVAEFRKALAQLSDTEPVVYQLLGALYEKMENYKEAVAAYEKYLELAPEGNLAPAVRSIIDQLRRQAAEQASPSN